MHWEWLIATMTIVSPDATYDQPGHRPNTLSVLSSDDAYVLALEFDRNPIVDDEAAFDLYPL